MSSPVAANSPEIGTALLTEARARLAAALQKIEHCVAQLSDEQLWWRPRESHNSIGNLLLHVTGNLRQRIVSLVGGAADDRNRAAEFAERGPIAKGELLARLTATVHEADAVLAGLAPVRLLEPRSYQGVNRMFHETVLTVIYQTTLHLAGHTQEIVFMTRFQLGEAYRFELAPASGR